MTRVQFLNDLYRRLGALERAQAEEWLTYYAEMLADRMEEGMSEEEAVASMEDLDVIARRILQEAGLPPAYPSPPPIGGGGTRVYTPPRKRSRLNVCLWILAGIAVVFAGLRLALRASNPGDAGYIVETATDYPSVYDIDNSLETATSYYAQDSATGEECIFYVREDLDCRYYWLEDSLCEELRLHWPDGAVTVRLAEDGILRMEEYGSEGDQLTYTVRDRRLTVTQAVSGSQLTVYVPGWWITDVEADSANVTVADGIYDQLKLETGSGSVSLRDAQINTLYVATDSGSIEGRLGYTWEAELCAGSGNINLTVDNLDTLWAETDAGTMSLDLRDPAASEVDLETGSGGVELTLPEEMGFVLRWKTDSGTISSGSFALEQRSGGKYYCGDEYTRISVKTDSGNLVLESGW